VLLDNGFREARDRNGRLLYKYKSCIDKFPYTVEHDGKDVQVMLTEKRLVTYSPSLAEKKRYEINRMVEKAKEMTASKAKKSEYGEAGRYISIRSSDGKSADVSINRRRDRQGPDVCRIQSSCDFRGEDDRPGHV